MGDEIVSGSLICPYCQADNGDIINGDCQAEWLDCDCTCRKCGEYFECQMEASEIRYTTWKSQEVGMDLDDITANTKAFIESDEFAKTMEVWNNNKGVTND